MFIQYILLWTQFWTEPFIVGCAAQISRSSWFGKSVCSEIVVGNYAVNSIQGLATNACIQLPDIRVQDLSQNAAIFNLKWLNQHNYLNFSVSGPVDMLAKCIGCIPKKKNMLFSWDLAKLNCSKYIVSDWPIRMQYSEE